MTDDSEVVGDEHQREVESILEVDEQVDDLRLDRHVQRRDRLVGEDHVGLDGQRPGEADALALATGELVGVAVGRVRRESDEPSSSSTRAPIAAVVEPPEARRANTSGSAISRRTLRRGLRLAYGSWKTSWTRRR